MAQQKSSGLIADKLKNTEINFFYSNKNTDVSLFNFNLIIIWLHLLWPDTKKIKVFVNNI